MKFFTTLTIVLLFVNMSFAQGGAAYKQLKVPKDNTSQSLQYWGKISAEQRQANQLARERNKKANNEQFLLNFENALKSFKKNDFSECIYYYEKSKYLGFYDAKFQFITGISYYKVYKKLNKKKYKKKAKKLLKLSAKNGYLEAELYLDKFKK